VFPRRWLQSSEEVNRKWILTPHQGPEHRQEDEHPEQNGSGEERAVANDEAEDRYG
jgi:hypothetical protein